MADALEWLSDVLPLTYAYDALARATESARPTRRRSPSSLRLDRRRARARRRPPPPRRPEACDRGARQRDARVHEKTCVDSTQAFLFLRRDAIVANAGCSSGTLGRCGSQSQRATPASTPSSSRSTTRESPVAATWRVVGEAAAELGLRRPCYYTVRALVRAERARRSARTAVRAAALDVLTAVGSSRVVDLPIALDALELARAKERLVLDQHKPP